MSTSFTFSGCLFLSYFQWIAFLLTVMDTGPVPLGECVIASRDGRGKAVTKVSHPPIQSSRDLVNPTYCGAAKSLT